MNRRLPILLLTAAMAAVHPPPSRARGPGRVAGAEGAIAQLRLSAAAQEPPSPPVVVQERTVYDPALEPYVSFLSTPKANPVDYLMKLFERADIVILCERFHPEATQYDLIYRVVTDPRFVRDVGRVFTEVGSSSLRPQVRELLHAPGLSQDEVRSRLSYVFKNIGWDVVWEKSNFFDLLAKLQRFNETLPEERKVDLLPSDLPFSWDGMTAEKYREFKKTMMPQRDRIMADQVASEFDRIQASGEPRRKALVIMNYRHAFNNLTFADGGKGDDAGRYLFDRYPGRVANVLLNTVVPLPRSTDKETRIGLVQGGKWDAAFLVSGNTDAGFDFAGSPFGADAFDLFPFRPTPATYQDVFTGFVFYRPLSQHRHETGAPGLVDESFAPVLLERSLIAHPGSSRNLEDYKEWARSLDTRTSATYSDFDPTADLGAGIGRWLRPGS